MYCITKLLQSRASAPRQSYLNGQVNSLLKKPHDRVDVNARLFVLVLRAEPQRVFQVVANQFGVLSSESNDRTVRHDVMHQLQRFQHAG